MVHVVGFPLATLLRTDFDMFLVYFYQSFIIYFILLKHLKSILIFCIVKTRSVYYLLPALHQLVINGSICLSSLYFLLIFYVSSFLEFLSEFSDLLSKFLEILSNVLIDFNFHFENFCSFGKHKGR